MKTSLAERFDGGVATEAPVPHLKLVGPGCRFLHAERLVMDRLLPGADARLSALPMLLLETSVAPGVRLLKDLGLPQLTIPTARGGLGASARETAQILRAVASRAPSLGLAAALHTFAMRTLVEYAACEERYGAPLLDVLACGASYLASGFAEAGPGMRPLESTLRAIARPDGRWNISGSKKPCTLARSMDFLSAGVLAIDARGKARRAVALVPADLPGVERRSLGGSALLAGAENDELILHNVIVPQDFVFFADDDARLEAVERRGCLWLEIGLAATYVGMASALVERALVRGPALGSVDRVGLWLEVEAAMAAVTAVAAEIDGGVGGESAGRLDDLFARAVAIRLAAKASHERVSERARALLGAAGACDAEVEHLLGLARALTFHPSSRTPGARALAAHLDGDELQIG